MLQRSPTQNNAEKNNHDLRESLPRAPVPNLTLPPTGYHPSTLFARAARAVSSNSASSSSAPPVKSFSSDSLGLVSN